MNLRKTKKSWMRNLRRTTRKRRNLTNMKVFPDVLHYSENDYLSNGSYGSVYVIPGFDGRYVLKQHQILDKDVKTCGNWDQEYKMHRAIYNSCNHSLVPLKISIVKPHGFGYGKYESDSLTKVPDVTDATHCYILMDRILGRRGSSNGIVEKKLKWLLGSHKKYNPVHFLPPYMFFGTIQRPGVISLDLLDGLTVTDFPIESLNYCTIGSHGFDAVKDMMMSFFIIAGAGFAPRDIEYVLDGNKNDMHMSVLDFNEVKTWKQRVDSYTRATAEPYDIDMDLAHIYIDLCGLRKVASPNPMALYDGPTPQWKFLCNPIVSPQGFFKAVLEIYRVLPTEKYPYDFMKVMSHIVDYICTHWLHPVKCQWNAVRPAFTPLSEFREFDYRFQRHIISNLWALVHDKSDIRELKDMHYSEMLECILGKIRAQRISIHKEGDEGDGEDGWQSMSLFA